MTEREKIIESINSVQAYGIMSNAFGGDLPVTNEMLADALIAAGIGDVGEWKHKAEIADRALTNTCAILYAQGVGAPYSDEEWQLYQAKKELQGGKQ